MPLISIIIPVYNASKFILNTLNILESQSYKNFEIIIINDGSTDNSLEILNEFQRKNSNIIIYNQNNKGVSEARNKGIELSKGKFVTFLDSDDYFYPYFLEKMILIQKETNADLIYCGYNRINSSGKKQTMPCHFKEGNILINYLDKKGYFHFSGMLINKKILIDNSINFEINCDIAEDLLFTVKLLSNFQCFCIREHLFNYVQRTNSVMSSPWTQNEWLSDINVRKDILSYLIKNYNKDDKEKVLELASISVFLREISYLIDCLKNFKYKKIKNYIKETDFFAKEKYVEKTEFNNKDRKKFLIIKRDSNIIWFFYTLYYRFFRFRF